MCKFFDNIPLDDEENITEERVQNIKASVLSRIKKEERTMKKSTAIKTLSIAGIAAATAMMSVIAAGAETAWTPMTDVENTVDNAAEMEVSEVTAYNSIDEAKTDEKVNDWTVVSTGSDLATTFYLSDDSDVGYIYYFEMSDEDAEKLLSSGWTLIKVPADE